MWFNGTVADYFYYILGYFLFDLEMTGATGYVTFA